MTEEKKLDRDDLVEKLYERQEIIVCYANGHGVAYRVTEYSLRNFMAAITKGVNRYNLTCWGKAYVPEKKAIEWVEMFVTVNFANVMAIHWPEKMAKAAHELVDENIDKVLDMMCADEEKAAKFVSSPLPE